MSRAIQKAPDFTADFENIFGWYVDKAGVEVAWHFQTALTSRWRSFPSGLIWVGPGISVIPSCGDYVRFKWSILSRNI